MSTGRIDPRLSSLSHPGGSIRHRRSVIFDTTGIQNFNFKFYLFFLIPEDFGRIAWQEFKGGGDITEGGTMVFMERDKRNCTEPHRVHGSLVFRDGEPKDGEKRFKLKLINFSYSLSISFSINYLRFPHGTQVTFQCVSGSNRDRTTWQIVCSDGSWNDRPSSCGK